jgi:hypothetical protein
MLWWFKLVKWMEVCIGIWLPCGLQCGWFKLCGWFKPIAQTMETSPILKLLIVWASVKWPWSKWDIKGGMILKNQWEVHGKPNNAGKESPLSWGDKIKARILRLGIWIVWPQSSSKVREILSRSLHLGSMMVPFECCKPGKKFELSIWKLKRKVDSSEEACVRGFALMRRLFFVLSSQPL